MCLSPPREESARQFWLSESIFQEVVQSMQLRRSFAGLAVAVLATTCVGFAAGDHHKSKERGVDVTFSTTAKFNNGNTLPPGTYRMEVADNSQTPAVTFLQQGKVVATTQAKVVTEQKKNDGTEVDSVTQGDTEVVTSIRPAGWDEELTFGSADGEASR